MKPKTSIVHESNSQLAELTGELPDSLGPNCESVYEPAAESLTSRPAKSDGSLSKECGQPGEEAADRCRQLGKPRSRLRGARVLLVEDHPINREIVRDVLERSGALVTTAGNGSEAVWAVQQAVPPFGVVLMDIQMPVMNGIQATSRIREGFSSRMLPIIAMTANTHPDERERCLRAGMNDHVAKPIDLAELLQAMNRWLPDELATFKTGFDDELATFETGIDGEGTHFASGLLPGLNLPAALQRMGGNGRLLARLLADFRAEHQGAVAEIREAFANGSPCRCAALLHMLRGLAGNLGAEGVCDALTELERAVPYGSPEAIELLLVALEGEMQLLFAAARTLEESDFPRQGRDVTEIPGDPAALCSELSGLLSSNNMRAVQLFERLSLLLEPSAQLEKLAGEFARLDFKNALVTLETVARGH